MGAFTKTRLKSAPEFIEGVKKGDFSVTKKTFSIDKTIETITKVGVLIATTNTAVGQVREMGEKTEEIADELKNREW